MSTTPPVLAPAPAAADTLFPSSSPAPAAAEPEPGASGTLTLTVPEGGDVFVTEGVRDRLLAIAKVSAWTQSDLDSEVDAHIAQLRAQHQAYTAELDAHPEIGGVHKAAAQQDAQRALDIALPPGTPERQRWDRDVASQGLTNYTPLVLALVRVGRLMREDGASAYGTTSGRTPSTVETMFPSTPQ
jgi:hypothetical protein